MAWVTHSSTWNSKFLNVYGVGNALVDLEFEIPESKLGELKIDKGLMTLIEEDRHHELLSALDGVEPRPCGGGSAANTIVASAQLGANSIPARSPTIPPDTSI